MTTKLQNIITNTDGFTEMVQRCIRSCLPETPPATYAAIISPTEKPMCTCAQLAVKLLVGLDLFIQFPLQPLLSVLQALDLLLRLIHLPLRRLQPLSQLQSSHKLMCSSSACIFISLTLRSSLRGFPERDLS
ncbi:hypothetical protein INR49_010934 [Caranx melampygus]|nr:hypothetical protein INR49_010934 [Caranx melampygus]